MDFLRVLEGIRTPVLDTFFSGITYFGEETLFLVVGLILFWCVNKGAGQYLMTIGISGTVFNQCLKITFRIPRPWVLDESFTIVESARAGATGYSFPSGHTQIAVGVYGGIARWSKKTWVRIVFIALAVLVPFSRMYLGVHTPLDVGVATVTSLILLLVLYPPIAGENASLKKKRIVFLVTLICSAAFVCYVNLFPFPADIDQPNYAEAVKTSWLLLGSMLGMWVSVELDEKYIHFETKAPLPAQLIKVVGGLALVMGVRAGAKPLFSAICGGHPVMDLFRYFLVTFIAAGLWPMTFKKLSQIGQKK